MVTVRPEGDNDRRAVHRVQVAAFGRVAEADLVETLRAQGCATISLVAEVRNQVVGHILFSPVTIEDDRSQWQALGLGPMAVLPEDQRQGIGTALIREGLQQCGVRGHEVVVVLGHREYYPRFGFIPASRKGLRCEFPVPDEAFMVVELVENALRGRTGSVKYHRAFGEV